MQVWQYVLSVFAIMMFAAPPAQACWFRHCRCAHSASAQGYFGPTTPDSSAPFGMSYGFGYVPRVTTPHTASPAGFGWVPSNIPATYDGAMGSPLSTDIVQRLLCGILCGRQNAGGHAFGSSHDFGDPDQYKKTTCGPTIDKGDLDEMSKRVDKLDASMRELSRKLLVLEDAINGIEIPTSNLQDLRQEMDDKLELLETRIEKRMKDSFDNLKIAELRDDVKKILQKLQEEDVADTSNESNHTPRPPIPEG